jgi:hypothetical protein
MIENDEVNDEMNDEENDEENDEVNDEEIGILLEKTFLYRIHAFLSVIVRESSECLLVLLFGLMEGFPFFFLFLF